jgi:hypothetical protein
MLTEKLHEIMRNHKCLISIFDHFANICLYLVKFDHIWFIGIQI